LRPERQDVGGPPGQTLAAVFAGCPALSLASNKYLNLIELSFYSILHAMGQPAAAA
jgi:hypothetical protein